MKVSFDVDSEQGDVYRVTLSSGCDAFFVQEEISEIVGNNVEVVEIDQDDRPLFMHLIARQCHAKYVELLKDYIIEHYGK